MCIYTKAALLAYKMILEHKSSPVDAWIASIEKETNSSSSRKKTCPKETFLGLVYGGFLKGIPRDQEQDLSGILRERAIKAAMYATENLECTKHDLSMHLGYEDKQGAYGIVLEFNNRKILSKPV